MQNIGPVYIEDDVLPQENKKEEINLPQKSVLLINKTRAAGFSLQTDHKL